MMGGSIRVESVMGAGSTFSFTIPYNPTLHPKDSQHSSQPSVLSTQHPAQSFTILIAEDDSVCRLVLATLLKADNITILSAVNGQEAVDMVRQHPEINLVFMDIKMPVMNGYEATRHIKEFRPDLPVIAQTAFTSAENRENAIKAGCDGFITKPIKKSELHSLVDEKLGC